MDAAYRSQIHDAMVRLADGDRAAFDGLVDLLWPVILSFVQRGVGRHLDAEDVAQNVFFRICSRIADFDRERDALSWAFGIASYEVMTHRRRLQRRREVFDEPTILDRKDPKLSPEELLLNQEVACAFELALQSLSARERQALGLDEMDSTTAVATVVRKRKQRAVERLRGVWRYIYGDA